MYTTFEIISEGGEYVKNNQLESNRRNRLQKLLPFITVIKKYI